MKFACGAMAMFLYVEEMGPINGHHRKCCFISQLREHGIATWARLRLRVRHPRVGPADVEAELRIYLRMCVEGRL